MKEHKVAVRAKRRRRGVVEKLRPDSFSAVSFVMLVYVSRMCYVYLCVS